MEPMLQTEDDLHTTGRLIVTVSFSVIIWNVPFRAVMFAPASVSFVSSVIVRMSFMVARAALSLVE